MLDSLPLPPHTLDSGGAAIDAFVHTVLPFAWKVLQVAIGIGIVIFVHELGHFLVAKKVGIRVETFSLGFGPRLLGFRRGPTDYRLSLIPLGGYVKMAGENPGEDRSGAPDEFTSKTVGQRAAVISAGVIMNTIFAVIGFLVAFKLGVSMLEPVVGRVEKGTPAYGILQRGDKIVAMDGEEVLDFIDASLAAAFADGPITVEVERAGERKRFEIAPRRGLDQEFQRLGIEAIHEIATVEPGSAAAKAGLGPGDRILAVDGVPIESEVDFIRLARKGPGKTLELLVARPPPPTADGSTRKVALTPEPRPIPWVGLEIEPSPIVTEVRDGSPAQAAGLGPGDRIVAINGEPANVETLSERLTFHATGGDLKADPKPVRLTIATATRTIEKEVTPRFDAAEGRVLLGMGYTAGHVAGVAPGSPAAKAGIEPGSRLLAFGDQDKQLFGPVIEGVLIEARRQRAVAGEGGEPVVKVGWLDPKGQTREAELSPVDAPAAPPSEAAPGAVAAAAATYGETGIATFRPAKFVHVAPGLWQPIRLGVERTGRFIKQVFLTLGAMFAQRVSPKALGGPVLIGRAAYEYASFGVGTLIYFLAFISINLAVLNILPIPILDGGHLVFLLVEKIKGSPVSPSIQGYFQWAGLVALLFLMVFVTKNDIARLLGG